MNILFISSEPYCPEENPLMSIFQIQQMAAIKTEALEIDMLAPCARSLKTLRFRTVLSHLPKFEKLTTGSFIFRSTKFAWDRFCSQSLRTRRFFKEGEKQFQSYLKARGKLPDIIHAHNVLNAGLFAEHLSILHGIPYIITEHSSAHVLGSFSPALKFLLNEAYSHARYALAVSPTLGISLSERYQAAFSFVPNVIPPDIAEDAREFMETITHFSIPSSPFQLISIGSLDENKNHESLINAFSSALAAQPNLRLVIVGGGPLESKLRQLVASLGISQKVSLVGWQNREGIKKLLRGSHALIHSSKYETFGVSLIEAAAYGLPLVSTRSGGPEGIITPEIGLLTESNGTEGLCQAIIDVKTKYYFYDRLKINQIIFEKYGSQRLKSDLMKIYEDVMSAN